MNAQSSKTIVITGGAGFIGSNLADRVAAEGHTVRILDSLARPGVAQNLEWLTQRHGELIEAEIADLQDESRLHSVLRDAEAVFHFAAQVAVTTSIEQPVLDFETNIHGTFKLLEAVRNRAPAAALIFASTNKVYGDLGDIALQPSERGYCPTSAEFAAHGVPESQPLSFHTPYGCSKGAADQYVLDYARSYGLRAAVLRMSCIYGQRQFGTEDQGWVAHFLIRALEDRPITLFGDGKQVRDVCDVADTCGAYLAALENIDSIAGRAFNWGGGPGNAVSLLTLVDEIGAILGKQPQVEFADWRPGDQRWFVTDTRAFDSALNLPARTEWKHGVRRLAQWLMEHRGSDQSLAAPRQPQMVRP